jgi:hypothetical protein
MERNKGGWLQKTQKRDTFIENTLGREIPEERPVTERNQEKILGGEGGIEGIWGHTV